MLCVRGLSVEFAVDGRVARAVDDVDLEVHHGETLALVGESGCGKTMTALSILGLTPSASRVSGSITLNGDETIGQPARKLRSLRGSGVAMVFQEPVSSLNPVMRVGDQIVAALRAHRDISRDDAKSRAIELLAGVLPVMFVEDGGDVIVEDGDVVTTDDINAARRSMVSGRAG